MRRMLVTVALFVAVLFSTAVASDYFYINIEGKEQGKFKGESTRTGHTGDQVGLAFSYELIAPTDRASGQASGKRQHGSITITKEWGAASPQLFQALTRNEQLTKIVLSFVRFDDQGNEVVYHTITLTNARIIQMRMFKDLAPQGDFSQDTKELETISFSFETIEFDNKEGKTKSTDRWKI